MAAQRPYTLVAELTYRCPLKCLYCSNPIEFHAMREELTTRQWCQTFTEASDLGVVQVHLSGGEPLVRNDLPELIRHARECDLYTNLITSGTLLNEDKLREFRACGLEHIQLSMQDTDREQAEIVAGIKSYDKKLEVAQLIKEIEATPGYELTVDLAAQTVTSPSGTSFRFDIDPFRKDCLLHGLDEIGLTLENEADITAYEQRRKQEAPWLFLEDA